jgi:FAD/FMN-containing dehydrogenase
LPSRAKSTFVLQEYFVPTDRFGDFVAKLPAVLKRSPANVLNIAIRHTPAQPGTLLSWAPHETFCFVLYYEQGVTPADRAVVRSWTAQLIQLAIDEGGDYYLPYQIVATKAQFLKAYPRAPEYFALKKKLDPTYKFHNRLWDAYYTP